MENIQPEILWNLVLTVLVAPLSWFLKGALDRTTRLEHILAETREEIAKTYATKQDVHNDINRLLDRFDRLEQKIDRAIASR